jgi:hypothetical protein
VSDHALTPGDPRRTIHFVITRAMARRMMGRDTPVGDDAGDSMLAWSASRDDPDSRRSYLVQVNSAWGFLGFAFIVAMVLSVPIKSLAGVATGNAFLTGCLVAGMFCMAGCANVLWRIHYVRKAERLARKGKTNSEEACAAAMRRTLPRNTSLIFQTAAAIVTLILAL